MLRLLLLVLLLTNLAYLGWTQGLFSAYGLAPATQSEPQRLAEQLEPQALRILPGVEAQQLEAIDARAKTLAAATALAQTLQATNSTSQCLEAAPLTDQQASALRTRLTGALPAGTWVLQDIAGPGQWMIYMGRYSGLEALNGKKDELRRLGVAFQAPGDPGLEPGLSLGKFDSRQEADAELARMVRRGIKTARIVEAKAPSRGQKLRLPAVTTSLRQQLDVLQLDLAGKALQPCR